MKEKYIELMERTLSAYSKSHIQKYFEEVEREGLTEHGFPRLISNIGILIAHGKRSDLLTLFLKMMDFCTKTIPNVKAANDFSVREIVSCIKEVEKSGIISKEKNIEWKTNISKINPHECYNIFATLPTDKVKNWALFSAVSEFFRQKMNHCNSQDFIDIQLATQLQWLDENGMYMDADGDTHHPIMYDLVARGLFALILNEGYRGRYYKAIDDALRRAGLLTLEMQSVNGEMAFGGRSNQFIHNEAWLACVYEYEAKRYFNEGNLELAGRFKAAIKNALEVTERWLSLNPIYHIKNRFPLETKHGCEGYAYFDKYMITVASNLHAAYQICDDTIPLYEESPNKASVFATSKHFHKIFMKGREYSLEFDIDADPHYDANGLGRIHKAGAPAAICLSLPCPAEPMYSISIDKSAPLSLCPGILSSGKWEFACVPEIKYELVDLLCDENYAYAELHSSFRNEKSVTSKYKVTDEGVQIDVYGEGDIAYMLPAFQFDGEEYTEINLCENVLSISYKGWLCSYFVDGAKISDMGKLSANRNGLYKTYAAIGKNSLKILVKIKKT